MTEILLKVLFIVGGSFNLFFAVRAFMRGYDTHPTKPVERQKQPFAFWFDSIFLQGVLGLALIGIAIFYL